MRRLFLRFFLLPSVDTLLAVAVTKARLRQKLAGCAPLQIVRKNNFFGVAIQAFSCFCQDLYFAPSFFLRFSFADCMHLAGGCCNEGEITPKTRWLCPFANCTKTQLFRRGYASIFLLLACSLFCAVFLRWKGVSRLSETGLNACATYKRVLVFLFSAKTVRLAFLYFCFGQIFTSLHLFLAVKIIKYK